jgi:hypothetical protein
MKKLSQLSHLRRLVRRIQKRLFPTRKKIHPRIILPGVPDGVDLDLLNEISREHFNAPVASTFYEHLSGWKTSGAYRIHLSLPGGQTIPIIYKIASYESSEIPALEGLPVQPGPAEYAIYSQPAGPLEPYLPKIYKADEVNPGKCYRYILEDLFENYHLAKGDQAVAQTGRLLPNLHHALQEWTQAANTEAFLQYGSVFSLALQEYAHPRLVRYQEHVPDPGLKQVLDQWADITAMHLRSEFQSVQSNQLIHGDLNFTNIHLHNADERLMKLVDWEWAGFGQVQSDWASLLKGTDSILENTSVQQFYDELPQPRLDPSQNLRLYHWAQLERGLLDASFLSVQYLEVENKSREKLPFAVRSAARRVLTAYRILSS